RGRPAALCLPLLHWLTGRCRRPADTERTRRGDLATSVPSPAEGRAGPLLRPGTPDRKTKETSMRYGFVISRGDPSTVAELAYGVGAAGWDGAFYWDGMFIGTAAPWPIYDPWVVMAAMALRTRRVRIGAVVTPLARRRPWKVAREAATLDHLSGGR